MNFTNSSIRVNIFMSLILNLPSKLCLRKPVLVRCSPLHSNSLSSASLPQTQTQTLPLTIFCADPCRPHLVRVVFRSDGDMNPLDYDRPSNFMEVTKLIGSSNGWITSLKDGTVRLREHPRKIPDEQVTIISLPPHVTLPLCQTQMVTNVAMSSSSPEEEDCAVAVKFLGPQLSICKPAQSNAEWIHVRISNPCFFSSPVMYSEKEDMFRIVGSGGHLIGSWDLGKHKYTPKIQRLQFQNLPEMSEAKRELLYSCNTSENLVESRTTGETFLVKWYKRTAKTMCRIERMETKALMVFKIDEEGGNAVYTQDIGDLCIFLTRSESFCVPASSVRHMRPNRVKIIDVDEITVVDLAAQNLLDLKYIYHSIYL